MSNESSGNENDQAWIALTANDPAKLLPNPELDAIKASVLSSSGNVTPILKNSWLKPVAVAASVALFVGGGAGYTVAAQSVSNSSNTISAPALEMGSASGVQDEKISSSMMWGGRPFLEADSRISDSSGTQVGYTFDASDVDRKAKLAAIAQVFGVPGEISGSNADGLLVGDNTYATAVATTSGSSWDLDQLVTWSFSDSSVSPQGCDSWARYDTKASSVGGDETVSNPSAIPEPMPTLVPEPMPTLVPEPMPTLVPECELPTGSLPSDESAIALAKMKFAELGLDSTTANWIVTDSGQMWGYDAQMAAAYKSVTAKVLVDGQDSNQSWNLTMGPNEVVLSAGGFYAQFNATSSYEIVGAKTAIERTQNGLWMNLAPQEIGGNMMYPMDLGISQSPQNGVVRNADGQPIVDGGLDRVTIVKAEQSLMLWYLNDGSTILLPAYLLTADNSRQWLQLSIADQYVDFS